MTPTRRAFNHVSLNNTRSNAHSIDAARSKAGRGPCSTAVTRVNNEQGLDNMCGGLHTREQLTNWVMSKDSVASCFIKDVLSMSESGHAGVPYYFLGRVPCRSVSLVAIVVGAAEYESRIVYTLDDGTGTIECAFRTGEGKPESKPIEARHVLPLPRKPTDGPASTISQPPPLIPVGSVVTVQGKVRAKRDSRVLHGETIVRCRGLREELEHWQRVTALHKNYYFLPERFVIPPLSSVTTAVAAQDVLQTPKATKVIASLASTPSTSSSTTSSPAKASEDASRQPRLRHPSRLRTRDLTENTFRIYVKHFMDNLRYLNFVPRSRDSDLEEDSDADSIAAAVDQTPRTPTKKRRAAPGDERTPRLLSRRDGASALITPRPSPRPHSASRHDRDGHGDDGGGGIVFGCTLSFLLRVPELANLACRVVKAEARRRERTRESQSGATSSLDPSSGERRRAAVASSTEGSLPKVKRLFSWAIRRLYQDGSIIIWNGRTLPVPEPHMAPDSRALYRSSHLDSVGSGPSRLGSRRGGTQPAEDGMEDLSDPPSDEEAYASLSTAYLATQVEQAIRSLTALQTRRKIKDENTCMGPAISRRRLLPPPGPTKEDITTHLRRGDDRWKRINGWAVQEALEWLRDNGRGWCISEDDGGRWELCS